MNSDPDRQHPFLSFGFRPFFLFAGVYGAFAMLAWIGWISLHDLPGIFVQPTFAGPPQHWHGHEMIFGYAIAVVSGFILTAVPNWTGARRVAGLPLLLLATLWLIGRLAMWFSTLLPLPLVALVDLIYLPALGGVVAASLMVRPAPRNLVFLVLILVLAGANAASHAEWLGFTEDTASRGLLTALFTLALMVVIIGGRIVPAFTRNVLIRQTPQPAALPRSLPRLDAVAVIAAAALIPLVALGIEGWSAGTLAALAFAANLVRLSLWRGDATGRQPILLTLHTSYAMLVLGYGAFALANLTSWMSQSAAFHLIAIGGIGGMTLAVMTRAALGHTGRALVAAPSIALSYALVALAGLVRSIGLSLFASHYTTVLVVSAALWIVAFGIFSAVYMPILIGPASRMPA